MIEEDTYTFIGAGVGGEPLFMDIAALHGDGAAILYGQRLFDLHDSGAEVEVWRGIGLVARLARPCPALFR